MCVLLPVCKLSRIKVWMFWSQNHFFIHISSKTKNWQRSIQSLRENVWFIICDQVTTPCIQLDCSDEILNVWLNHFCCWKFHDWNGQFGISRVSPVCTLLPLTVKMLGLSFARMLRLSLWEKVSERLRLEENIFGIRKINRGSI